MGELPATTLDGAHAVVTGGAGFIGSWLCERLLSEGARVWGVDSFATGSPENVSHLRAHPAFTLVESDVVDDIPDPGHVDLVVHLSDPGSPTHEPLPVETAGPANAGTVNALELAERRGARFVLASGARFAEATTMAYGRARNVDVAIARIFETYGPRMRLDDGGLTATLLDRVLRGEPLIVSGEEAIASPCWVEDVVDGLVRLARSGERGPLSLASDSETTILELAQTVSAVAGTTSEVRHTTQRPGGPTLPRPDVAYARRALGWEPTMDIEEGLKRTAKWMEERLT